MLSKLPIRSGSISFQKSLDRSDWEWRFLCVGDRMAIWTDQGDVVHLGFRGALPLSNRLPVVRDETEIANAVCLRESHSACFACSVREGLLGCDYRAVSFTEDRLSLESLPFGNFELARLSSSPSYLAFQGPDLLSCQRHDSELLRAKQDGDGCKIRLPFHWNLVIPRVALWINDPVSSVVFVWAEHDALSDDVLAFFHIDRVTPLHLVSDTTEVCFLGRG